MFQYKVRLDLECGPFLKGKVLLQPQGWSLVTPQLISQMGFKYFFCEIKSNLPSAVIFILGSSVKKKNTENEKLAMPASS